MLLVRHTHTPYTYVSRLYGEGTYGAKNGEPTSVHLNIKQMNEKKKHHHMEHQMQTHDRLLKNNFAAGLALAIYLSGTLFIQPCMLPSYRR